MTLLSIAQDVCDVIGLPRPAAIVTGADQLARQILGLAKETLEELGQMDWPILQIPYTFATVAGQGQYALPADFGDLTGDTVFSSSQYYQVRGSLSPGDWARQRNALPSQLGRMKIRVFGLPLKANITPTPTSAQNVVLEYVTTYRVMQSDLTYKDTFFADDDVPLISEDIFKLGLKWRLRRAKGLDYSEEFDAYEKARTQSLAQALSFGSQPVAYRSIADDGSIAPGYVPEQGYGA
jgi:hypothetical protein